MEEPQQPTLLAAIAKRVLELFWEWLGIRSAGDDINAHIATTTQKAKAITSIAIIVIVFCIPTFLMKGCYDNSKIESLNGKLNNANHQLQEAQADRNKFEIKAQIAENALAPWKQLANSKFPNQSTGEALTNVLKLLTHEIPNLPMITIKTLEGLPPEKTNDPNLKEIALLLRNTNDVELDNVCSRLQLPEPIVETPEKPEKLIGTQLEWRPLINTNVLINGGNAGRNDGGGWIAGATKMFPEYIQPCFFPSDHRGTKYSFMAGVTTGVWELQVDKIPPGGYVLIRFITSKSPSFTNYISFANEPLWAGPTNPSLTPDTNELRFYFEGQYQFQSEIKPGTHCF